MQTLPRIIKPASEDARMSRVEAAEYLGVSVAFLASDVVSNRHKVPYIKCGRAVVYLRSQLDVWITARMVNAPAA